MLEQSKKNKRTNRFIYAVINGFFAGLIWGGLHIFMYYFKFTKVLPAFLAEPFLKKAYIHSWKGHLTGLVLFIIFSILAALLYTLFLRKAVGPWPGIIYGAAWWSVLFLAIGPAFDMMPWIRHLGVRSAVDMGCLFVLWGVFIGYSISFEFNDERAREHAGAAVK